MFWIQDCFQFLYIRLCFSWKRVEKAMFLCIRLFYKAFWLRQYRKYRTVLNKPHEWSIHSYQLHYQQIKSNNSNSVKLKYNQIVSQTNKPFDKIKYTQGILHFVYRFYISIILYSIINLVSYTNTTLIPYRL